MFDRHERSDAIFDKLDERALELADALGEEYTDAAEILNNEETEPNPVLRLAEALTLLQGRKNAQRNFIDLFDSSLLVSQPNGIAMKRRVTRKDATNKRRTRDVRSLVLSDTALEYLVHLHVLPAGNRKKTRHLSFEEFLGILEDRYGFLIDREPAGMTISNDDLQRNRGFLERRLRDLGLLVGVNDAEAMKRLTPRFERTQEQRS